MSAPGHQPILDNELKPWEAIQKGRQTGMQIAETVSGFAKGLAGLLYNLFSWMCIPAEVFLHHSFGVRYLNPLSMLAGLVALAGGLSLVWVFTPFWWIWGSLPGLIFVIACITHSVMAKIRTRRGHDWHSRCPGMPYKFWERLPFSANPFNVLRFHEPLALILSGIPLAVIPVTRGVGVLMGVFAAAIFVKYYIQASYEHAKVLDQIDQQIESELIADLVEQSRTPWEGKGFIVSAPVIAQAVAAAAPSVEMALEDLGNSDSQTV